MTYAKVNVPRNQQNSGRGTQKKDIITFIDVDDISSVTSADNITTSLVMKAGKYGIDIFADRGSIKIGSQSEGDFMKSGIVKNVEFEHPGNHQEIRDFRSNWINKEIIVVIENCETGAKLQYGTPCAPLELSFKHEDNKDTNLNTITLKSIIKDGTEALTFNTNVTKSTVMGTAVADATSVDVIAGEGEYQMVSGTSAAADIIKLENPRDNYIYTLKGIASGNYAPRITDKAASTDSFFYLKNGTSWTANASSKLTVRAFKNGASSFIFVEISRS